MAINGKPTVISTFAGTGGSSLGYKWAGYEELLAIDFDAHAVECFKANFPEVPVWHRSVVDVTGKEIMDFCGIKPGDLDVFDGSPPCQGFSTAGKRVVSDPRNDLFAHYCRLVTEIQPKVFVMENVTGMAKGKMRGKFIEIMKTLKSMNYNVKCKQMNAKYYGVPQARERLMFVGVRKDMSLGAVFPVPSKLTKTVRDVLPKVHKIGLAPPHKDWVASNRSIQRFMVDSNRAHSTIVKSGPNKASGYVVSEGELRRATIDELKLICSFPSDWILTGKTSAQWARLGNAVMPKFMQAIATTIKEDILNA